jgi:hypothetical protein
MTQAAPINTAKVTDRRKIHFDTLDQMLDDVHRLADAERQGKLRCTGNWTLGQILNHLATWMNFAYQPVPVTVPWFFRLIGPLIKHRVLNGSLPVGSRIPNVPGGTLGTERLSLDDGLAKIEAAVARLKSQPTTQPSPLFGRLTDQEWQKLTLRHAELHLSFCHPE